MMLGKKSKPVMEILTGALVSGQVDAAVSPRTSPRGPKSFDFGGVGLGIVAALEKSGGGRSEIPALFSRNLSRSSPIPVSSPRNSSGNRREPEEMEPESLEEYTTIVTCRGPNKKAYTKVYSDGIAGGKKASDISPFRIQSNRGSVFHISPARFAEAAATAAPVTDFLSCCNLCQKKLHGKDIYMYRGEKAFCSTECRYRHMAVEERAENCSSEASRAAVDVAGSPQFFTVGILAT